jgi:hypothetical protein
LVDHALCGFACAQEYTGEVGVDDGLPLGERHLADHLAVLHLHQHAIAHDARVVDQSIERAEIGCHLIERAHHAVLVGGVGDVAARRDAQLRAAIARFVHILGVHIEQREIRALGGEMRRQRAADTASGTGHENRLATNIH